MTNSQSLELASLEFRKYAESLLELILDELSHPSRRSPLPPRLTREQAREHLFKSSDSKITFDAIVKWLSRDVLPFQENLHHPGYFGWIFAPSNPIGALVELLGASLNLVNNSWRANPILTEIELTVIKELGQLTKFGECGGVFLPGGSAANLTAIIMARNELMGGIQQYGLIATKRQLTGYVSEDGHFSLDRAFDIVGIGKLHLRKIPLDQQARLRIDALESAIDADIVAGHQPFCVIGNAGTTSSGAIDPFPQIAKVARHYSLWFHIDGAYGGFAAGCERLNERLIGIDQADSLTVNPHKWLFAPIETGCLLVRNVSALRRSFEVHADYLSQESLEPDLYAYGFQTTRIDRALKVYLSLAYYGKDRFLDIIESNVQLAHNLAEQIRCSIDFQCALNPELSIVVFRYVPQRYRDVLTMPIDGVPCEADSALDALNAQIEGCLASEGTILVSSTRLFGRFWLRLCIVNYRTTAREIGLVLETIRTVAAEF